MLKTILLGPGRLLCGRGLTDEGRHRRYRLAAYKNPGEIPVIIVSLIFWALAISGAVLVSAKTSNVNPPRPQPAPTARTEPAASAQAPEAGNQTAPPSAVSGSLTAPAAGNLTVPAAQAAPPAGGNLTAGAVPAVSQPQSPALAVPPEIWLVIVESIPKSARPEAERALARHKKRGVELELLDTDAFPKLKSGMWTLALGPFDSKKEADAAAVILKPKVKDLMVRRGL
jgi:hypothetical protein